jgi:hypothetical protein
LKLKARLFEEQKIIRKYTERRDELNMKEGKLGNAMWIFVISPLESRRLQQAEHAVGWKNYESNAGLW